MRGLSAIQYMNIVNRASRNGPAILSRDIDKRLDAIAERDYREAARIAIAAELLKRPFHV